MKMRFPLFAIAAASVFAVSCTADKDLYNENYKNEVVEATYEDQFMKMVGSIGAQQDFNMATNYTITVDPGMSTSIKVFAPSTEGVSELVADCQGLTGKQTISFTGVKNTKSVYVVDAFGNVEVVDPNNGSVSFKSTRVISDPDSKVEITPTNWEKSFNFTNSFKITAEVFSLVSKTAKFPIYFTNGGTSNKHDFTDWGIYYWDANGNKHVESVYKNMKNGGDNVFDGVDLDFSACKLDGIKFGLFVEVDNDIYFDYQTGTVTNKNGKKVREVKYSVVKSGDSNYIVVGFDFFDNGSDNYDDVRFVIGNVDVLSGDEFKWALACEDMGTTGDFDFNDVVFTVSHVEGQKEMTVMALAAGGTLDSEVYYDKNGDDNLTEDERIEEIHKMLQVDPGKITNTYNSKEATSLLYKIPVGENFFLNSELKNFCVKTTDPYGKGERVMKLPKPGKTPRVICVPSSWAWPKEKVNIIDAYPAFKEWSQNPVVPTDWYMNVSNPELVIK